MKNKTIITINDVAVAGIAVGAGLVAAVAVVGMATSVFGKVAGGIITYGIVSATARKAANTITEPIVISMVNLDETECIIVKS